MQRFSRALTAAFSNVFSDVPVAIA